LNGLSRISGQPCCFSTKADEDNKMLLIEITNKCNLSCSYCHSVPNTGGELALSDDRLDKLLYECKENSFKSIIVSGGEPLLSERVFKLSKAAKEKGLRMDLCTNGTVLTSSSIREIQENYDSVTVTLDTIDPITYSKMKSCRPDVINKVEENLQSLARGGVQVGVTIVLTKLNIDKLTDTLDYLKGLGIKKAALLRLYNFNNYASGFDLDYSEDFLLELNKIVSKYPEIKIKLKGWNFSAESFPACSAGKTVFAVDHTGHLLPCIMLRWSSPETNLVNKTLKDAMNSNHMKGIVQNIKALKGCKCIYESSCSKGCPATAYGKWEKILPDLRCSRNNSLSI
jgi:radical SAM protein with 4Fe4S-binding SPASM domain